MKELVQKMVDIKEAMDYIDEVSKYGSMLGLENTRELMKRLSNPQDELRFIHVAGTNGKGSTCTYIASILKEAGYRVGRYISPTVFGYLERIQIEGRWIEPKVFTRQLARVKESVDAMMAEGFPHPTVFEIETAVAFLEFLESGCDFVVLEVGLGGRLDATNVILPPLCTVITSISMDHMGVLGDSLEKIAEEKAGIIKQGTFVVSHEQKAQAEKVLQQVCTKQQTGLKIVDKNRLGDCLFSLEKTEFWYDSGTFGGLALETTMLSENQVRNAMTAVEAVSVLKDRGFSITKEQVIAGIAKARWEGRFSIVWKQPYVIVDGAHNEEAANSLNHSIRLYFGERALIRIIGVFRDKEYEKIIANTVCRKDTIITVRPPGERGLASKALAACAKKYCERVYDAKGVEPALQIALDLAKGEKPILVYGSLSFLHEVYAFFEKQTI